MDGKQRKGKSAVVAPNLPFPQERLREAESMFVCPLRGVSLQFLQTESKAWFHRVLGWTLNANYTTSRLFQSSHLFQLSTFMIAIFSTSSNYKLNASYLCCNKAHCDKLAIFPFKNHIFIVYN